MMIPMSFASSQLLLMMLINTITSDAFVLNLIALDNVYSLVTNTVATDNTFVIDVVATVIDKI